MAYDNAQSVDQTFRGKSRHIRSRTHLCHPFPPESQVQGLKVPWHMDLDILVPLFVSRLEGGPEATHSCLFPMDEDLSERVQLVFWAITSEAGFQTERRIYDMLRLHGFNKLRIL